MSQTAPPDLSTLYSAHHGWLQGWLRLKLGSGADAADVAHDTFLRILQRRDRPQPHLHAPLREPRAYLTRIAQGLVIDHYRRRDVEYAYLQALAAQPEPTAPSPETRLLIIDTLVRLDTALDALKPRARQAFLLAQLDGLTGPAIAAQLDVSLATVERDLASAWRACYRVYFL